MMQNWFRVCLEYDSKDDDDNNNNEVNSDETVQLEVEAKTGVIHHPDAASPSRLGVGSFEPVAAVFNHAFRANM